MIPYEWTSGIIGLLIAGAILFLVRRRRLHGPYALWWLGVSAAIVLISLFPQLVNHVAYRLGISYPPILPVLIGIGLLLIKILTMDIERSRQELRLRRLTQRLGILDAEITQLKERNVGTPPDHATLPEGSANTQTGESPTLSQRESAL